MHTLIMHQLTNHSTYRCTEIKGNSTSSTSLHSSSQLYSNKLHHSHGGKVHLDYKRRESSNSTIFSFPFSLCNCPWEPLEPLGYILQWILLFADQILADQWGCKSNVLRMIWNKIHHDKIKAIITSSRFIHIATGPLILWLNIIHSLIKQPFPFIYE